MSGNPLLTSGFSRWLRAFTVFILTMLAGAYIIERVLPKTYSATALIQVGMDHLGSVPGVQIHPEPFDATFAKDRELLISPQVLLSVIEDLNLTQAWSRFNPDLHGQSLSQERALEEMLKRVRFEVERGTNIIKVEVDSDVPQEAADIGNEIARSYQRMKFAELANKEQAEIERKNIELRNLETSVESLRKKLDLLLASLPFSPSVALDKELHHARDALVAEKQKEFEIDTLQEKARIMTDPEFVSELRSLGKLDNNIDSLASECSLIERNMQDVQKEGGPSVKTHLVALQKEEERKRIQMATLITESRQALKAEKVSIKREIVTLKNQVTELEKKQKMPGYIGVQAVGDLQHELDHQQFLLDYKRLEHRNELQDDYIRLPPVRIISFAAIPLHPSGPNRLLCYSVSFFVAAMLSLLTFLFGNRKSPAFE